MRIAYADPPYLGYCKRYDHDHPDGRCWDDLATHQRLVGRLSLKYPDGWALSASSPSLRALLPLCPDDVRVGAWFKPFAVYKPNVNPAYAWEPVIFRGGRKKRSRQEPTVRDWVSVNIALQKGLTGAKPPGFCRWLFELMGLTPDDELVDLFPGTGIVTQEWDAWRNAQRQEQLEMGA